MCALSVQRMLGCTGPVMLGFLRAVLLCAVHLHSEAVLRTSQLCFHSGSCIDTCKEATFLSHSAPQTGHNVVKGK